MSALPAAPHHAHAPAVRRHLRLVETPQRGLAPSGPLQAWRRRIGAVLVLVALVVIGIGAVRGPAADAPATSPVSAATAVVEPGQTLWDVAAIHAPADVPTGAYLVALAAANGIEDSKVDAWQVLVLPTN